MAVSFTQLQMLARERLPERRHAFLRALTDAFFETSPAMNDKAELLMTTTVSDIQENA